MDNPIKALVCGHKHLHGNTAVISIKDVDCSIAYHGLEEMDAEVDLISPWWTLNTEDFEKYDVCVSGVSDCTLALWKMGIRDFEIPCYPESIKVFLSREIEKMTFKSFLKNLVYYKKNGHKFVKPVKPKAFQAFLTSDENITDRLYNLNPDIEMYVSDIVNFKSEWRVYVKLNKIVRVCHYSGNPLLFPNPVVVNAMVKGMIGPCCYALDVGVFGDTTALVEVNDFYAIGNYGLYPREYVEMLMLRWSQLTGRNQFSKPVSV